MKTKTTLTLIALVFLTFTANAQKMPRLSEQLNLPAQPFPLSMLKKQCKPPRGNNLSVFSQIDQIEISATQLDEFLSKHLFDDKSQNEYCESPAFYAVRRSRADLLPVLVKYFGHEERAMKLGFPLSDLKEYSIFGYASIFADVETMKAALKIDSQSQPIVALCTNLTIEKYQYLATVYSSIAKESLNSCLLQAAVGGDLALIKQMLKQGADPKKVPGITLHAAALNRPEVLGELLLAKADPFSTTTANPGSLNYVELDIYIYAFESNSSENIRGIIKVLNEYGMKASDKDHDGLLTTYVMKRNLDPSLLELLSTDGVNLRNEYLHLQGLAGSPLFAAIESDRSVEYFKTYEKLNAFNAEAIMSLGPSRWNLVSHAISYAKEFERADLIRLLLKNGANPNRDTYELKIGSTYFSVLMYALNSIAENPNSKSRVEVLKILLDAGANVNTPSFDLEKTPIMFAARTNPEVIQLLIDRGANILAKDSKGQNVFNYFDAHEHPEIYKVLYNNLSRKQRKGLPKP